MPTDSSRFLGSEAAHATTGTPRAVRRLYCVYERILALAAIALCTSPLACAGASDAASPPQSVLGAGSGLNHVSILVSDLRKVEALFENQLGFNVQPAGRFPDGLENAVVRFSDHTYLEFLAVYDPKKAASSDEAVFLKKHEGADGFGLEMGSAERALALLRSRGIGASISTTTSADYTEPGLKGPSTWLWRDILLPRETPGSPFLVEYNRAVRDARARSDPVGERRREQSRVHANGALRLSCVWVATKDLDASTKLYQRLGFVAGRAVDMPELSASGREIAAGNGLILLLTAKAGAGGSGPVSEFLAQHDNGVMGVTIEVEDLARAHEYLKAHGAGVLDPRLPTQNDLLIPAAIAHGLWLRLSRPHTPVGNGPRDQQ